MLERDYLHIGDVCWWSGTFGLEEPKMAEITSIESKVDMMTNCGIPRRKLGWSWIHNRSVIVTLGNGHWAYGNQLTPLKMWQNVYND